MKDLYVVDASGYLFSSYYAIRNMTNSEGQSTNALFGFVRAILNIIRDFKTENVVVAFDGPNNSATRKAIYPDYKANRKEAPPDLYHQMKWAEEFCKLMGIPSLSIPNVEADDTMGSVAVWASKKGVHVYLCSTDKDLCQFVDNSISMLHTRKENAVLGPKEVEEQFGIPPNLIVDYLTIVGDTSDNIPGLPGFGPKTAVALLKEYGNLDNILNHPENFTGKKREIVEQGKAQALISRKLLEINTDLPIPHETDFYKIGPVQHEELKAFYLQKNFLSFLKELEQSHQTPAKEATYHLVDDEESLNALKRRLESEIDLCFDTETTDVDPLKAELVGIGFASQPAEAWYVPCNGKLGLQKVVETFKPLFENPAKGFYGHNTKYDLHVLENVGIRIARLSFDTLLASYILNAHQRQHNLDALSLERYGKVKIPIDSLIGKGKNQITMLEVPIPQLANYCSEDADYTCRLKLDLSKELKTRNLEKVFYDIELALVPVLARMERRGIFLDAPFLQEMSEEVRKKLAILEEEIYAKAGLQFNLNSPKQLSEVLIGLGIKLPKKTATGFSTSAEILESIVDDHPVIPLILDYRVLEKLRSTYIDSLPQQINPKTHRIHCNFNQSVAATGRLSSQDPNLQNIPARTEIGRKIRAAFRPQKADSVFLGADYSQIELRLMAHLSNDPGLIEAFNKGEDIHVFTAAAIYDVHPQLVTKEMRQSAKAVNFGIIYGQGPVGLSKQLGITRKQAADFIETYFQKYKRVKSFVDECIAESRKTGKAVTMTGRERALPEITSSNGMLRSEAERLAVNTPLQGSAADLIKLAMIDLDRQIEHKKLPAAMILQIHDELLFEVPLAHVEEMKPLIKKTMENVWTLKVPLIVDIALGKNWAEC